MIGTEILRVLRDEWSGSTGAKRLAEELFVILGLPDIPVTTSAPINSTKTGTQPLTNLFGYNVGDSVFSINRAGLEPIDINLEDLLSLEGAGADPNSSRGQQSQQQRQQPSTPVFFGTVQGGGPGTGPYTVELTSGSLVDAFQQQIDANETIPAGTAVLLLRERGTYKMQVPVWL